MSFKEVAIIGATASGKSSLALKQGEESNSYILSIDSLSVYKEINIVSAKPSKSELERVQHFGVNEIYPDMKFDVTLFIELYKKAKERAIKDGKNLIIVGGTSFYLKTLFTGLSQMPKVSEKSRLKVDEIMLNLFEAYKYLESQDSEYSKTIKSTDKYRIEKALDILIETETPPSIWFKENPPKPILNKDIPIINISIERELLIKKIELRTNNMIKNGLIDEVKYIVKKYGRDINPIKAIGIRETILYLDGEIKTKKDLSELISIHTRQLAKRQTTFNRTQFQNLTSVIL